MIYAIQKIHHLTLISRGCAWLSMKRGGCKFGGSKTGALSKKGGCSFTVGTQAQRVSALPPPPSIRSALRVSFHGKSVLLGKVDIMREPDLVRGSRRVSVNLERSIEML